MTDRNATSRLPGPELRKLIRTGRWTQDTGGLAPGYVRANVVILPAARADDFRLFCARNPAPCPLLEVTEPGSPQVRHVAVDGDLRTDVPRYRVYRHGTLVDEPTDIRAYWRDDLVGFLLGCSGTLESELLAHGVPNRYAEQGTAPPAYRTSIRCASAGVFRGPLVVSMRPIPESLVACAAEITSRFPLSHGAPVHIGDPGRIGIHDLARVDYGEPCTVHAGDVPVFWACGITPEAAGIEAQVELMITHKGGHMFVGDLRAEHMALT